jgi:hypothetical protein
MLMRGGSRISGFVIHEALEECFRKKPVPARLLRSPLAGKAGMGTGFPKRSTAKKED